MRQAALSSETTAAALWKKHQRELTLGVGVLIIGGGITGGILAFSGAKEEPAKESAKVDTTQVDTTKVDTVPQPNPGPIGDPKPTGTEHGGGGVNQPAGDDGVKQPVSVDPAPSTSKNLGYGKYEGAMKNGQPHGRGIIYYNTRHQVVPSKDIYAESGDYVDGSFRDGKLVSGQLHRKDGNQEFVQR